MTADFTEITSRIYEYAYGIDLRGYGETPRDPSGWNTPLRAAADVAETAKRVPTNSL